MMKNNKILRNFIRLFFILFCGSFGYYFLNKIGYFPPVSYFLNFDRPQNLYLRSRTKDLLNYNTPVKEIINGTIDRSQTHILVEKSLLRLTVYYGEKPIKSYPIVLGKNPIGDKLQEGDYKTPEGIFKIRDLYSHSSWSKFIWLDYPNKDSWRKHLEAKKKGIIKVNATIGGEIGIHGVNRGGDYLIDTKNNWTWGCIALKNKDVDEIYNLVRVGSVVIIRN